MRSLSPTRNGTGKRSQNRPEGDPCRNGAERNAGAERHAGSQLN